MTAAGRVEVRAPADCSVVGTVAASTPGRVSEAVASAREALCGWAHTAPHARAEVLHRAAAKLAAAADDVALLHARESGKVISEARREVEGAAGLLEANAGIGRFHTGSLAPTGAYAGTERDLTLIERVPLGVVVCVVPFNFPIELTVEKAAAALAAGNVVILKPPPQNPLAAIRTASIMVDAGLPPGVLQTVPGGREISAALCAADGVDAVSLTGSVAAGVAVARSTASMLRPLHLELGGNGAVIVLDDADPAHVTSEVLRGRLLMNGQACAATKRIIAMRPLADELTERLADALAAVAVGDPTSEASRVGPLIDAPSAARVASQVDRIIADGGKLVAGSAAADGAWFPPALLASVPATAQVAADDEIFGPVFPVIPVADPDEAVAVANQSRLALTAAVFSADVAGALETAERLQVGGVVINGTNNYRPPVVPFGGIAMAGSGREGIGYTYEEMTRTRFIALRNLRPAPARLEETPDG